MTASDAAYLAAIVASSDDAIIGKDLDGRIMSWNPAAESLFGYVPEEVLGKHVSILIPRDHLHEEETIMAQIRRGQRLDHFRTVRRHKDGSWIHVSLTVSPILNEAGDIIGASKIVRDITARIEADARLEQLQQELLRVSRLSAMGQMASALAHELNQPLSSAGLYASGVRRLLAADEPNVAMALQGLDKALEQIQRVGDIIRRMRGFVERGEIECRLESLPAVVAQAIELLAPSLRAQCTVELTVEDGLQPVLIDRVQIQQVLLNLFRNAIEAMSESEVRQLLVDVLADPPAEAVLVKVADTGPGIPPEVAERLFQPFYSSKSSGMGVGLSICRTIVEAHGGRISVGAHAKGGAEFIIALPVVGEETGS